MMKFTTLLVVSCIAFLIGTCCNPLLFRLYFLHGGNNVWLFSFVQSGGWPIILIPLLASYLNRRRDNRSRNPTHRNTKLFLMEPSLFVHSSLLGLLYGLENYLFAYGCSKLPVSTFTLILSTQLVFISVFAFLLVKQSFTVYSVSAILLLTFGAASLAINASSDLPDGETDREYVLGFVAALALAAFMGLFMPLMELAIDNARQVVVYALLMEINMVICVSATVFSTVGMLINDDFTAILQEARGFELGEVKYYVLLISCTFAPQFVILGTTGMICYGSSLFYGVINAALLPVTEILGVITYQETFGFQKIVSLLLCVLGFTSYFYGEKQQTKKQDQISGVDSSLLTYLV